mgnify:FL=1
MSRYGDIIKFRKSFDLVTNWVHYPIAGFLCTLLSFTSITPNQITFLAILSEIGAVYFILTDFESTRIWIVVLLQLGWILDLMDGMMARYKKIGYYHPTNPTLKGYYWDSVSDHALRLLVLTSLGYYLTQQNQNWVILAFLGISIHAITQVEHILRDFILKNADENKSGNGNSNSLINHFVLLINNIYLYYFIFILWNRIELLFIFLPTFQFMLLIKRFFQFSFSDY